MVEGLTYINTLRTNADATIVQFMAIDAGWSSGSSSGS